MVQFQNVLSKAGAVLAVVLVLAMTCLTAFADVTVDFSTPGTYTLEIAGGNNSSPGRVDASGTAVAGYTYDVTFTGTEFNDAGIGAIQISSDGGTTWETVASVTGAVVNAAGSAHISYTAEDAVSIRVQSPRIGLYDAYTVTVVVSAPRPLGSLLGDVESFAGGLFNVGGSLVTFITAPGHWVVLVPLILFLLVFCVSGIRKLIAGV